MKTVKFHEGTKVETSLDLEDGEGVIFVKPEKNSIWRTIGMKYWYINLVITDKRLVTIPLPPNKKNRQVESYYFKDISDIRAQAQQDKTQEASMANFSVSMKGGGKSSYVEGGVFTVRMVMAVTRILGMLLGRIGSGMANQFNQSATQVTAYAQTMESKAHAEATGASTYTEYSPNFTAMDRAAKASAANMDFSRAGHQQIRDYIVNVVSQCVDIANGKEPRAVLPSYTEKALPRKFTGKARYLYDDGAFYEGEFVKGEFWGKGKLILENGDMYEGDWVDSAKHGKGKYTFKNGNNYEGDWVANKHHGKGKWTNAETGEVYIGDYADDKRNGYGKLTMPDGTVKDGRWKNGDFVGK
jgi:hypothetical protein